MIFRDSDHAARFKEAVQTACAARSNGAIKADLGASLYILTGLPGVYGRVEKHIHPYCIDFEPMLHMGLSTGESILVSLAGNLYNGGFFDRYTPFDLVCYCDADGVALAIRALELRKGRMNINEEAEVYAG